MISFYNIILFLINSSLTIRDKLFRFNIEVKTILFNITIALIASPSLIIKRELFRSNIISIILISLLILILSLEIVSINSS